MNKLFTTIFFLTIVASLCFPNGQEERYNTNYPVIRRIDFNLDIANNENIDVINAINNFNAYSSLFNSLYEIYDLADDRIYFETQIGMVQKVIFADISSSYSSAAFSLKVNLSNPKIPMPNRILSKITSLEEYVYLNNLPLSDYTLQKIARIKKEITEYNSNFFFKRFGFGITFPYALPFFPSEMYTDVQGHLGLSFLYNDIFCFLSYDFTDFTTLQLGCNVTTFDSLYITISTDISTPIRNSGKMFFEYLSRLLGLSHYPRY
ncbi:MAG: hypothetical protein KAU17_09415 [Spirochaetales bacterium]|nr:hypothetical protein [Spirochaetales bacterium]